MTTKKPAKAANGEGRLYEHSKGNWAYQITLGKTPVGKPIRKFRSGFRTKTEAKEAMRELMGLNQAREWVEPSRRTLNAWLDQWCASAQLSRKQTTAASYVWLMKAYVRPVLGERRLQDITRAEIEGLYSELMTVGARNTAIEKRKPLSARTVRYTHTVLRMVFRDAVEERWLAHDPSERAAAPSPKQVKESQRDFSVWSVDDVNAFLRYIEGDELEVLLRVAFMTGKRRSELLGLRWKDVGLDEITPHIRTVLATTTHGGKVLTTAPKTDQAGRIVAIDRKTAATLREYRAKQRALRLQLGTGMTGDTPVFQRADGTEWYPQSVTKRFQKLVARAGLPHLRFHDIRHTYATTALRAGVNPKVVSERIGHKDVETTLRIYAHFLPADDREAAEKVANLFGG